MKEFLSFCPVVLETLVDIYRYIWDNKGYLPKFLLVLETRIRTFAISELIRIQIGHLSALDQPDFDFST